MDRASETGRAQWLSELAEAIEQAQQLAWALGVSEGTSADARELYGRLEAIRIEVAALRRDRSRRLQPNFDPEWLNLLSWCGSPPRRAD